MSDASAETHSDEPDVPPRVKTSVKISITPSLSDYPRSHAANYTCPVPITPEQETLRSLKKEWTRFPGYITPSERSRSSRELIIADLCDFEIYRCPETDRRRSYELTSLHLFDVKAKNLCFDGHVQLGGVRQYLQRVSIHDLSIEGYGQTNSSMTIAYLQTKLASKDKAYDIWLRLRTPAPNYERFHSPFLWVTTFGKFVLDYMDEQPKASVALENFTHEFHTWLIQRMGHSATFKAWHAAFRNTTDFRVALVAYVDYIYNQAVNLSTSNHLRSHPVWSHCKCDRMMAIERQPNVIKETLATPHVFQCFKDMYFASRLKQISPARAVGKLQGRKKRELGFVDIEIPTSSLPQQHSSGKPNGVNRSDIRVGDVVSIMPDDADKVNWRSSGNEWLAFVQGVEGIDGRASRLLLLWLYRPADTNMYLARYPHAKELFLSDNCNCGEREVLSTDVIRKHSVAWFPDPPGNTTKDFVIRQTYITQDSAFTTVKDDHKTCACRRPKSSPTTWSAGDTVYVSQTRDREKILEPVVIHKIDYTAGEVQVRSLLRLNRDCAQLAREAERTRVLPNELVLTGSVKMLSLSRIQRACHVRFVPQADVTNHRIPSPYDKGGAGDYWFISMGLETNNHRLVFLSKLPKGFREARDVPLPCKKLRGLSLFSGGGSLDRGLEEGGAVVFETSVDYDAAAIHTQRANCHNTDKMRLFCGSVDDYFQSLLSGEDHLLVAPVGKVEVIVAGSPCPGFSALQHNPLSHQSLTYASHVTTFCTAVDVYRPLYGVLENVVNMASTRTGREEQNVLSQLVACLVSMGYQVNQYIMDSWTYGSCQRRSRIILTIAAPGLEPILQRPHTHSRSYEETAARSLGKLPNGERFGDREHYPTPFPYVSAKGVTLDLPNIGNGNVQTCIPFPDHRISRPTNRNARALLECIPRQPPGCGYAEAVRLNLVPPLLQLNKQETAKSYSRIKAEGLIPTITTDVNMQDARNGASVHWSQHRPLSILEARRTQGYPDHEPVVGTLGEQWKTVGNGVDRKVSFALGLALRDALVKSKSTPKSRASQVSTEDMEYLVDVEEEEVRQHFPGVSGYSVRHQTEQPLSTSFPANSVPQPQKARKTLNTSMSFDGAQDASVSNGGHLFSQYSRTVTVNVKRLSLPSSTTGLPSKQLLLSNKRPREEDNTEQRDPLAPAEKRVDLSERPSLKGYQQNGAIKIQTPKSEPQLKTKSISITSSPKRILTRNLDPAELAPNSWHKKVGNPTNIAERM